jgi:hypothetical protein
MNYVLYFIIIIIIIYIILFCYVKIKFHFWNMQPVFHYYNILYWFSSNKIINEELPSINKYCNLREIQTYKYNNLTELDNQYIVNFLKNYFLRTNEVNYIPTIESFNSNFENHIHPSFVSIYSVNSNLFDYKNNIVVDVKDIIGIMTTRPLYITLYNKSFPLYYVDHLCVHNAYRKKGIAPQIIQTHELNQRHNNKQIKVSLFKREGDINGIVPLTFYYTYGYKKIDVYRIIDASVEIVQVNRASVYKFLDFYKIHSKQFDCSITPHLSNLISLIESKTIFIYLMKQNDNILCFYVFRNTDTSYNNKKSIECISSITTIKNDKTKLFYRGFTNAYYKITKIIQSKILLIEETSHNKEIITHIKNQPFFYSPTAFFLYNYVSKTTLNDKFIYIY